MELHVLNKEEMRDVYDRFMVRDFPEDELKPLDLIGQLMEEGRYLCLGIMEDGELCGYGILVYEEESGQDEAQSRKCGCLLDYLAVRKDRRGTGLGSAFLQQTRTSGHYLVEVEDPAFAADTAERAIRERRIGFYRRCGFRDTGVRARLFGVEFLILDRDAVTKPDDAAYREEVRRLYTGIYEYVLGRAAAAENLILH